MKKKFFFDEKVGFATCSIIYKNNVITGSAQVCPEDEDMTSERVGLFIAESRANIKYLKFIIHNELEPQLKILQHLQGCIESSKNYNEKSYEAKMIRRLTRTIKDQLITIEQEILLEKKYLKDYLTNKDKFYKKIRKNRNKDKTN